MYKNNQSKNVYFKISKYYYYMLLNYFIFGKCIHLYCIYCIFTINIHCFCKYYTYKIFLNLISVFKCTLNRKS